MKEFKYTEVEITIPATSKKIAVVTDPTTGSRYYVPVEKAHPGNFPWSATELNSVGVLKETLFLFSTVAGGPTTEVWGDSTYKLGDSPKLMNFVYRLGKSQNVYPREWRNTRIETIRLLRRIKDNGGLSKYNYPNEAYRHLERILTYYFVDYPKAKWLLKHFGLTL